MILVIRFLHNRKFNKLYKDLEIRVKEENKTSSSWLMGYMQGLGNRVLTGYQFAALVDLLLVQPETLIENQGNSEQISSFQKEQKKQEQTPESMGRIQFRP